MSKFVLILSFLRLMPRLLFSSSESSMIRYSHASTIAVLSLTFILLSFPVYACNLTCREEKLEQSSQALLQNFADNKAREYLKNFVIDPTSQSSKYQMRAVRINELFEYIDFLERRSASLARKNQKLKQASAKDSSRIASSQDSKVELRNKESVKVPLHTPPKSESESVDRLKSFLAQKKNQLVDTVVILQKENDLFQPRQKISMLTDQLAGKTLELIEKESLLTEQKEDFQSLENSLQEAEERMNLVQRIIADKDQRIQVLEKDVTQMQALTRQGYEVSQKNIEDLKLQFVQLHDDLNEQMSVNHDKIAALEALLADQEKKLAHNTLGLKVKSRHIVELADRLQKKNQTLAEANVLMESQDKKIVELDGIIKIYKSKLSEANQILREKVEKIRSLETQSVNSR